MYKRERVILVLVVASLLAAPVAFSGGQQDAGESGAPEAKTVSWLHIWGAGVEKEQITKSIELFEQANPDVAVDEIIMDASTWQPKLIQMLSGDAPPDIFLWYPGPKTWELVDNGVIGSLSGMWKKYKLDDLIPTGLKAEVTYNGELYNLPWGYHPSIVMYNVKMFDRLGLGRANSVAEFESNADKINATGIYPIASGWSGLWRSGYAIELLIPSYTGPDFYANLMAMKEDWGDAKLRPVYDVWKRWVQKGYWYPDPRSRRWAEGLTTFMNDEAGMYILGTYGVPMLKKAGWELGKDFDAFLFPQENKKFPMTLTGPFDTWSKAAKAPHPEEADRLLAFLATKDPQTMRARYHGGMACNKDVTEYDAIGTMVKDALNGGAVFHQVIGNALPPLGAQLINKGSVPDFYDDPDIEAFIEKCEKAREQYWAEKKK